MAGGLMFLVLSQLSMWGEFGLASARIEGTTVYFDRAFENEIGTFGESYRGYLGKLAQLSLTEETRSAIIADVNQILGATSPPLEEQEKILRFLPAKMAAPPSAVYLVDRDRVKDYLRRGGTLPGLDYDPETDTASVSFVPVATGAYVAKLQPSLIIPLSRDEDFREQTEAHLRMLESMVGSGDAYGTSIHEVVEGTFYHRSSPRDARGRWFADGVANVVAAEILRRHLGDRTAQEFLSTYSPDRFADLRKESNLRYWMFQNFRINAPIEREQKLHLARYAFATAEVGWLVQSHGIECIREITDALAEKDRWSEQDLFAAIREVTGEDMTERLLQYQAFSTRKDGMAKYAKDFNSSVEKREWQTATFSLFRVLELYESQLDPKPLRTRKEISKALCRMGYEQAADAAMQQCLEIFDRDNGSNPRDAARQMFLTYCLETDHPEKGTSVAREMLGDRPDYLISLSVLMLAAEKEGRTAKAKEYAEKIRALDPHPYFSGLREAERILSVTAEIPSASD